MKVEYKIKAVEHMIDVLKSIYKSNTIIDDNIDKKMRLKVLQERLLNTKEWIKNRRKKLNLDDGCCSSLMKKLDKILKNSTINKYKY